MDIIKTREEIKKGKTIYEMPLKVAYYARVSTDKEDQLNSLDNQQKYFEEMINSNKNWILIDRYIDEGISGTTIKNRKEFIRMIDDATKGKIDLILTKEISRFSRNTIDSIKYTEYLLKNGVIVHFISDNLNTIQEDSEFRLTIMSSLAQDEVRKLSERVKFGINRMIKDRKLIGSSLTGYYKKDGKYTINPTESPIIEYLFNTYASGKTNLKLISKELANMGYLNKKKEPYSQTTLAKFLTNPRYKGYYTAHLTEVIDYKTHKKRKIEQDKQIIEKDESIPAIISEELWNQANEIYKKRKRHHSRHIINSEKSLNTYKYTCLIQCSHCKEIYVRAGGSNRKTNPTWICKKYKREGLKSCASPIIKECLLDNIFINIFKELLINKEDYINNFINEYENIINKENNLYNEFTIKNKISVLQKEKDKLLDLLLKEIIDEKEYINKKGLINKEYTKLNNYHSNNNNQSINNLKNILKKKTNIKNQLSNLIKILINKIYIKKINNNRKHIQIIIHFNYNKKPITLEVYTDKNVLV